MSSAILALWFWNRRRAGWRREPGGRDQRRGWQSIATRAELRPEAAGREGNQEWESWEVTFSVTDAVGRHGPPNMDDATAVGHLILIGVLARVIIIQGMHDAQIKEEFVQNLREMRS